MNPYADFLEAFPVGRRVGPVKAEDVKKMTALGVPAVVAEFLVSQGLAFYAGDFLATTLPHWHTAALVAAKLKPAECFPFLRTALGTLLFLKKDRVHQLDAFSGKVCATKWGLADYLNVWLTFDACLIESLDRDVYERFARGSATLAIDEYFVIEPHPTGAYKVAMGLTGRASNKQYTAGVATWRVPTQAAAKAPAKRAATKGKEASSAIVDPNLKLAILEALIHDGHLALADLEPADPEQRDEKIRKHYLKLPLAPEQLAQVKTLRWGGGMQIQHAIWPEWDGEDDTFDLRDLKGIELLGNLEVISFVSAFAVDDLEPLAALPTLKKLALPSAYRGNVVVKQLKKRGVTLR